MRNFFQNLFGLALIAVGVGLFLYPVIATERLERSTSSYINTFEEKHEKNMDGSDKEDKESDQMYQEAEAYNQQIYENGQADFSDPWSCVQLPTDLDGLKDDCFGYIRIPAMEVELPLYVGASTDHMAKGAVVLGQTSLPIGGDNTNSVIAGHRGYHGAPFFREIEKLQTGDIVEITNPWETLTYKVESIDIIGPYDSHKVKIQEGKDMVTLLTCHPYRSHGKQRYVVYCVRDTEWDSEGLDGHSLSMTTQPFVSSEPDIRRENIVRYIAGTLILLMCIMTFGRRGKEK